MIYNWFEKSDFLPKDQFQFWRPQGVVCALSPEATFCFNQVGQSEALHSTGMAAFLLGVCKRDFQGGLHTTSSISTSLSLGRPRLP